MAANGVRVLHGARTGIPAAFIVGKDGTVVWQVAALECLPLPCLVLPPYALPFAPWDEASESALLVCEGAMSLCPRLRAPCASAFGGGCVGDCVGG